MTKILATYALLSSLPFVMGAQGGCQTDSATKPVVFEEPLITVTANQKSPCVIPESTTKVGSSKLVIIGELIVELEDCNVKRQSLIDSITADNQLKDARNKRRLAEK